MTKRKGTRKGRARKPGTRNGGRWTEARFRSFVISALRSASLRWRPKWDAISAAYIGRGVNPATGKTAKLYRCQSCQGVFPQAKMRADHSSPVVDPAVGWQGWDEYVSRMFVEAEGFDALCEGCHTKKTGKEALIRRGKLDVAPAVRTRRKPGV